MTPRSIRRILVPVDFSACSRAALDYAHPLASSLHATITLLHAYELPTAMSGIVPGSDGPTDVEAERQVAQRWLAELVGTLEQRGFSTVDVLLEPGSPIDVILHRASEGDFDLIVMGTHGRTGLDRLVVGSVAEGVLRRTRCAVLTIHVPA